MMRYTVFPLRNNNGGQTLADDALEALWHQVLLEKRQDLVFYAGGIHTAADFLAYIKKEKLHVCFVADTETSELRGFAWLTEMSGGKAFAHYCLVGVPRRNIGRAIVDYWCNLRRPDGQALLYVLLGITPEYHKKALRVIRIMGFTGADVIPGYFEKADGQSRCGAVISHYDCEAHRQRQMTRSDS